MGKLVVFRADGTAQDIKLDRERITIGRRPDNDVCLTHPAVSGEHAAVVTILADSFLEDLGSTNGTLVNGAAITKYFLRDRDEIDIGRQVLVYLADDAAKLEAPPPPRDRPQDAENGNDEVRASSVGNAANGQHDKRRSDGLAPLAGESVDAIQRFVAAEIESAANNASALHATVDPAESTLSDQSNHSGFALKVVSGAGAGRIVALNKNETVIGRAGVQVALRCAADAVSVVPLEGTSPPRVNGAIVTADGQKLVIGDILELAGTTLEFIMATT